LDLQSDRQIGFGGAGGLPFTSIWNYAQAYGIFGEDFKLFHYFIKKLDEVWLEAQ